MSAFRAQIWRYCDTARLNDGDGDGDEEEDHDDGGQNACLDLVGFQASAPSGLAPRLFSVTSKP